MKKGRPRGSRKQTVILLDYRSWIIEVDNNFPSRNYVVKRIRDGKSTRIANCVSLENALERIFEPMLVDNAKQTKDYCGTLEDLRSLILQTKREFSLLLDVSDVIKKDCKVVENKTHAKEAALP